MTMLFEKLDKAKIALFYDPDFVDLTTQPAFNQEASNMKAALEAQGHKVTTILDNTTEAWAKATKGVDVLVIPDLAVSALLLTDGAMFFIRKFVSEGGTLIVANHAVSDSVVGHNDVMLINGLFDTELEKLGSTGQSAQTGAVDGTTYEGGPTPISDNFYSDALNPVSLPGYAEVFYQNPKSNSTVAGFQYGEGQVLWLGWNWYKAAPVGNQDGGWNSVLDRSVSSTDFEPNGVSIKGTNGNDKVVVDPILKRFESTDLDDVMALRKGNDTAFGGAGHDTLSGEKGKDKLHGGEDDDFINGGKEKDALWGDAGNDYFFFTEKPGKKNADSIKDFVDVDDIIVLKQSKFDGLTVGAMTTAQFDEHIAYKSNGWLTYDGEKFAKLQSGGLDIGAGDFLVS